MKKRSAEKANRLINEKSPYLLQHAYNPVDWYPWGEEAFQKAKAEDKPVFLSIGYSTCHWCHVMEKDSFEDPEAAGLLNELFVPVKVDREERPDLDMKYMAACQALTGQGGWPLTVFLTPDKKPFFAGTFFPKKSRYGIAGLTEILPRLSELWNNDRQRVVQAAADLTGALQKMSAESSIEQNPDLAATLPQEELLNEAYRYLLNSYDHRYGGFGGAPKFPAPHQLLFLLRYREHSGDHRAAEMALATLRAMHRGGIFDQLGFGMHRYSVDEKWLVPHFEKMLYDQALTAFAACEAYLLSNDEEMADLARQIFSYVLSEMRDGKGAFYAAEDADSEGKEGTFYVWRPDEVTRVLGKEKGSLVAEYYGITAEGNFEDGTSVLHRQHEDKDFAAGKGISVEELRGLIQDSREKLFASRKQRERPFLDDKIITSWNGMLIAALARGAVILENENYLKAAKEAAAFILEKMVSAEGELLRRYRAGEAGISGFLDDYANLAWGLLEIYKASGEKEYLDKAEELTREMLERFDRGSGALLYSAAEDSDFSMDAEAYDGATPSGVSVAAMNLLQLGRLLQDEELTGKGKSLLAAQKDKIEHHPAGFTHLLSALAYLHSERLQSFNCDAEGNCVL